MTANAITACANDNSCLQAEFDRADKLAAAYDVALTLSHYPQLSKERADTLAQAVLDLAPGVSNASALYELLTGTMATGDEANRYFAAIGLVPVLGGIIKKGGQAVHVFAEADKAVDATKVGGKVEAGGVKAIDDSVSYAKWWDDLAQPRNLTDREARAWYLSKEAEIPHRINRSASLEEQAKQAFDMRNDLRSTARELMSDRTFDYFLSKTDPNRTWSEIVNKYSGQGL